MFITIWLVIWLVIGFITYFLIEYTEIKLNKYKTVEYDLKDIFVCISCTIFGGIILILYLIWIISILISFLWKNNSNTVLYTWRKK